jgi:hypothetical protein
MIKIDGKNKNNSIHFCKFSLTGNQGSSIILVIVAIAFVGILGSAILMLAMTNLQMKYTDLDAKHTFYSAEKAMDQIKAGLETEVSKAYSNAYTEVLQNYAIETNETRTINFKNNYIKFLEASLQKTNNTTYNIEILKKYLDTYIMQHTEFKETFSMTSDDSGILLQGIKVTYTDEKGIVSIIETDIKIMIPPLEFFSNTAQENNSIKVSDLIVYENWSKQ